MLIYGLYLVGARWDREARLLQEQIKNDMYCKMPVIHFNPIEHYEPAPEEYRY